MKAAHITTGSRLHFGLIDPSGKTAKRYGGAGLIVESPSIRLEARRHESGEPSVRGASPELSARILEFAQRAVLDCPRSCAPTISFSLERSPESHSGLGTGTQLGLAVARLVAALCGDEAPVEQLACRVERGRRSAVGLHGFDRGGFLVDGGKGTDQAVSPLLARHDVPGSWRFVLAVPREMRGMAGSAEIESFRSLPAPEHAHVENLTRLLRERLEPAIARADFSGFSEAIWLFGRQAGEPFREAQGGLFCSRRVADLVDWFRAQGVVGVGQSSWGPATFALVESEAAGGSLAQALRGRFGLDEDEVHVAPPRNRGAELVEIG